MLKFKERFYLYLISIIFLATSLLIYCTITTGHSWGDDFASYVMQAKSIVEGNPTDFLSRNSFLIQKSTKIIGPNAYPWGYPLLLAPIYAIFGLNIITLKIVGVVFLLSFLVILWIGFRKYHSDYWRIILVALFAFNPIFLSEVNEIHSDIPFLFFSTLTILAIGKIKIEKKYIHSLLVDHILLGILVLFTYLIRSNGGLLLLTIMIIDLSSIVKNICKTGFFFDKYKISSACLISTSYLSFLIILLLVSSVYPEGGLSHTTHFNNLSFQGIISNFFYYCRLPVQFISQVPYQYQLYILSIPLALLGLRYFFKDRFHIIIYIFLTFILYVLWPPRQGIRFIFPILPFYISFLLSGLERLELFFKKSIIIRAVFTLPFLIILGYFLKYAIVVSYYNILQDRYYSDGILTHEAEDIFSYIEKNIPIDKSIAFFKPRAMLLMTNRTSFVIYNVENLDKVDYVCLYQPMTSTYNQIGWNNVKQLMKLNKITIVYYNEKFSLYKLIK